MAELSLTVLQDRVLLHQVLHGEPGGLHVATVAVTVLCLILSPHSTGLTCSKSSAGPRCTPGKSCPASCCPPRSAQAQAANTEISPHCQSRVQLGLLCSHLTVEIVDLLQVTEDLLGFLPDSLLALIQSVSVSKQNAVKILNIILLSGDQFLQHSLPPKVEFIKLRLFLPPGNKTDYFRMFSS